MVVGRGRGQLSAYIVLETTVLDARPPCVDRGTVSTLVLINCISVLIASRLRVRCRNGGHDMASSVDRAGYRTIS